MTASTNRPATPGPAANAVPAERCRGTYTDRYDRPHPAPRPEGTYVSGAKRRSTPGSYTDVDGVRNRTGRTDGHYTQNG